jgi:6-phosphogluconolactonase
MQILRPSQAIARSRVARLGSLTWCIALPIVLAACGGGGSSTPPPPASYTIGGTVSGLSGSGLVLLNNGGNGLTVSGASFTFTQPMTSGKPFNVTVAAQPTSPPQACTVADASGVVGSSDITSVSVACVTPHEQLLVPDDDHYLVSYFIDPTTGALTPSTIHPVVSGLNYVADPTGTYVYVADGSANSVAAYTVSPTTAALTQIASSPFATAAGAGAGPLIIDPTGRFLYLDTYVDANIVGAAAGLYAYTRDAATGALTLVVGSPFPLAPAPVDVMPYSFEGFAAASPAFLYYSLGTGPGVYETGAYAINATTGALTTVGPFTTPCCGSPPINAVVDPTGQNIIFAYGSVQWYSINALTGALTLVASATIPATIAEERSATAIALSPSGAYVYAATAAFGVAGGPYEVYGYSVDYAAGTLTPLAGNPFATGVTGPGGGQFVAFDLTGQFLYVGSGSDISGFAVDAATGALTPVPGSPYTTSALPIDAPDPYPFVVTKIP